MSQKIWLVTGTSSGLGRRLVHAIIARKDKVIATARNLEQIKDLHTTDTDERDQLRTVQLDITDSTENIKRQIDEAVNVWGRVDVLVNNAGAGMKMLLEEGGVEGLMKQFQVNVFGTMNVTYAVLPHMRERRSGTIVMVGSRSAIRNEFGGIGPYAASKAAIHSLGETLATEVRPFNIQTLILQPGSFRTEGMLRYPILSTRKFPDYDAGRELVRNRFDSVAGTEKGDPAKGMELLVDVVRKEGKFERRELPLWLALGSDSERDFRQRARRVVESLDANSDISHGSDLTD